MTDQPAAPDGVPGGPAPAEPDDDRLDQFEDLPDEPDAEFARRVARAIERRRLANYGLEFGWSTPFLLFREFLAILWHLTVAPAPPRRTSDEHHHS